MAKKATTNGKPKKSQPVVEIRRRIQQKKERTAALPKITITVQYTLAIEPAPGWTVEKIIAALNADPETTHAFALWQPGATRVVFDPSAGGEEIAAVIDEAPSYGKFKGR